VTIGVTGGGAFGTALAIALALDGKPVTQWARSADAVRKMQNDRVSPRLAGVTLPAEVTPTDDIADLLACDMILLVTPAQTLGGFMQAHGAQLAGKHLVACCKGIDLNRMTGPASLIAEMQPQATVSMLTGPSFAADIARGLPTALTLACADEAAGATLQAALSTAVLRLYRSTDVVGAELGGALKNVMAIASAVAIGAGLGESARAALITRGFPEMQRLALRLGAKPETLAGLSGFGDLVLTCTSTQSRNYSYGLALGQGKTFDSDATVEGASTALAVRKLAHELQLDMPICTTVADLIDGKTDVRGALTTLLSRPLKEE